jgi:hypothetical protein
MPDALFIEVVRTTDKLKNKASRSMNGRSARNKTGAPAYLIIGPKRTWFLSKIPYRCVVGRR